LKASNLFDLHAAKAGDSCLNYKTNMKKYYSTNFEMVPHKGKQLQKQLSSPNQNTKKQHTINKLLTTSQELALPIPRKVF